MSWEFKVPMQVAARSLFYIPVYGLAVFLFWPGLLKYLDKLNPFLYSLYLCLLSCSVSMVIMPVLIWFGNKCGLVDHPDEARKHHKTSVPLTGGMAIFAGFMITIAFNFHFSKEMKGILVASVLIFIVGALDDRFGLSAKIRLMVQFMATLILILADVRITCIPLWLGGYYSDIIITFIWVIGITNSMNFIDGMDGLAAGTSIIYSIFFAIIATVLGQWYMMFLAAALAGGCLGFFPYNFRLNKPARVFLGDSGSTFLGFMFASFAILGDWGPSILDIAIPVIIMSVLIFDMSLTTIVRIHTGEVNNFSQWLHYTGRDHFHHRLMSLGISAKKAALIFFGVSICLGLEAITMLFSSVLNSILIIVHTILLFSIIGYILVLQNGRPKNAPLQVTQVSGNI
ncbi:MAG: MraY family glycosyltransferase [Chitinivibrionales bacterium]|nr:MraY family glycosyltransferase [Chitinivibrionales bacterium]